MRCGGLNRDRSWCSVVPCEELTIDQCMPHSGNPSGKKKSPCMDVSGRGGQLRGLLSATIHRFVNNMQVQQAKHDSPRGYG